MLSTRRIFGKVFITAAIIAAFSYAYAQGIGQSGLLLTATPSLWSWTTERWTNEDKSYRDIRTDIDEAVRRRQLTAGRIEEYWTQRQHNLQNPQVLFRWVYATYQAQQQHPPIPMRQTPGPGAFRYVPSPKCYQYSRIRFLINAEYAPEPQLVTIAKRLLQYEPSDYDVQYYLVKCFKPWVSNEEKQQALLYARDLIQKYPNKPSAYAAQGDVYHACWVMKRDSEDGQKAVVAYQEYLRLAPTNYKGRVQVEKLIYRIQHY